VLVLTVELTADDLVAFNLHYALTSPVAKRNAANYRFVLIAISALLAGWFVTVLFGALWMGVAAAVAAGTISYFRAPALRARQARHELAKAFSECALGGGGLSTISLDDEGLHEESEDTSLTVRWSGIKRVEDTEAHVYIYFGARQAFILPRRGQQDAVDRFAAAVRDHLGK
jgi:hypothetical protein